MSTAIPSSNGSGRARPSRVGAGVAVLVGLASVGVLPAGVGWAAPSLTFDRYAGDNRYVTAAQASASSYPAGSARTVVLASGASTVDALAGSYVAGALGGPVLLTAPGAVPEVTLTELQRLGATRVVLAGGEAAIGPAVAQQLAQTLTVDRAAGANRYETAAQLAALVPNATPEVVFVASGPADAAAVAPISAANGWPVLLTPRTSAAAPALAARATYPNARVVVVGGTDAVSPAVAAAFGATDRIAGANRFETATEIAQYAVDEAGFSGTSFGLALGISGSGSDDLADALTSGPILAKVEAPLLLAATPEALGASTEAFLTENTDRFAGRGLVFGGPSAVGVTAVAEAATAIQTTPPSTIPVPVPVPVPVPPGPVLPLAVTEVVSGAPELIGGTAGLLDVPIDFVRGSVPLAELSLERRPVTLPASEFARVDGAEIVNGRFVDFDVPTGTYEWRIVTTSSTGTASSTATVGQTIEYLVALVTGVVATPILSTPDPLRPSGVRGQAAVPDVAITFTLPPNSTVPLSSLVLQRRSGAGLGEWVDVVAHVETGPLVPYLSEWDVPAGTWQWRVVSRAGDQTATSLPSAPLVVTAPLAAVSATAAEMSRNWYGDAAQRDVGVTFTPTGGPATYQLQRRPFLVGQDPALGWQTLTPAEVTSVPAGTALSLVNQDVAPGTYEWRVRSTSTAGQGATVDGPATAPFTVLPLPFFTSTPYVVTQNTGQYITVSGSAPGASSVELQSGKGSAVIPVVNGTFSGQFNRINFFGENSQTISAFAVDSLGNRVFFTAPVTVDTIAPGNLIFGASSYTLFAGDPNAGPITGTAPGATRVQIAVTGPGGSIPAFSVTTSGGSFSTTLNLTSLPVGQYTVSATPFDAVGNTTLGNSVQLNVVPD